MTDSQKLDLLLSGMQEVKQDIHLLKEDVGTLKDDVHVLQNDIRSLKDNVHVLQDDVDVIKSQVTYLSLTIENDVRPSIQRVAEGHLDLSRNLHEAMKPCLEMEMLSLKVHMLEIDMRDVKAKLA